MPRVQNLVRQNGLYYYRRQIRLGPDNVFRLRLSLRTTCSKSAQVFAPMMALACERLTARMTAHLPVDGLTSKQRAEIYRRQMLIERDKLEIMHAKLQIVQPLDHAEVDKALELRLNAAKMANQDGVGKGLVEDS